MVKAKAELTDPSKIIRVKMSVNWPTPEQREEIKNAANGTISDSFDPVLSIWKKAIDLATQDAHNPYLFAAWKVSRKKLGIIDKETS